MFNRRYYNSLVLAVEKRKFVTIMRLADFLTFSYFANSQIYFFKIGKFDFFFEVRYGIRFAILYFLFFYYFLRRFLAIRFFLSFRIREIKKR